MIQLDMYGLKLKIFKPYNKIQIFVIKIFEMHTPLKFFIFRICNALDFNPLLRNIGNIEVVTHFHQNIKNI